MKSEIIPTLLSIAQIEPFLAHIARHMSESGQGSNPIFSPYDASMRWAANEKREETLDRWAKPVGIAGWKRAWGIFDEGRMIGHLDLRSRPIATALHRSLVGMGIEASHRRRGLGRHLLQTAIDWARNQPALDWLNLFVFSNNVPAHELYRSMGFQEIGRTPDMFRVAGQRIEDISMTLNLRDALAGSLADS